MIKILYHTLIVSLLIFIAFMLYVHLYIAEEQRIEKLEAEYLQYIEEQNKEFSKISISMDKIAKQLNCDLNDECGNFNY
ncbi:MAG: hypothetical protein GY932_07770 [Arcobacter sp.]|nr:hypothetical protein [Arcobacter sp.]